MSEVTAEEGILKMMELSLFQQALDPMKAALEKIKENQEAAEKKDMNACLALGEAYNFLCDFRKAAKWYKKAHTLDHPSAALDIARIYRAQEDYKEAKKWYHIMIERGDLKASFECAILQKDDPKTSEEAFHKIVEVAEKGLPQACSYLAHYYWDTKKDQETAEKWFLKAAQSDDVPPYILYNIAVFYEQTNRPEQYEDWLRKAADLGEPDAQYDLFYVLNEAEEREEAFKYLKLAADQGQPEALLVFAILAEEAQDTKVAKLFYLQAALAGQEEAMYKLACFLAEENDFHGAIDWCKQAVEAGHEEAVGLLAVLKAQHKCAHHH